MHADQIMKPHQINGHEGVPGSLALQMILQDHNEIKPFPIWPPRVNTTMQTKDYESPGTLFVVYVVLRGRRAEDGPLNTSQPRACATRLKK